MSARDLFGAVALGAATGARASLGPAVLALGPRPRSPRRLGAVVQSPWGRRVSVLLVGLELVGDKLPTTPSRLAKEGLAARFAAGLVAAGAPTRPPATRVLHGVLAGIGVAAGAYGGSAYRVWVADRGWPDLPAAVLEDLAAIGLARVAARTT